MPDSVANFLQVRHLHQRVQRAAAAFVRACAVLSMLLGAMVLAAWGLDLPGLKSALPGAVEMKANTALALLLSGLALLLVSLSAGPVRASHRRAAQALGVAVAAIGLATIAQYLLEWNLGIDEALVRDVGAHYTETPGRMSPYSAGAFAFLGIAHAALPTRRWRGGAVAFAGVATLLGLLSLMGYFWGASELVTDDWAPPMAVHTAAAFLLLGLGTLVAVFRFPQGGRRMRLLLDVIELRILASFVAALLALLAVGGLVYGAAADYSRHSERLAQIREFRGKLAEFYADAGDAAFAQRNYLVTGEPAHAERWWAWQRQLAGSRKGLRELARRVGSAERASFDALDQAVAELTALLEMGVQLYRREGADAARAFILTERCTEAMAKLRSALRQLDQVESGEEQLRDAMVRENRRDTVLVSIATLLAVALVLAGVFLAIRREMAARAKAEQALRRRTSDATAAHRFLESVIQNIPYMIFVKEAQELRYVHLNRAGENIGLDPGEVVGKNDRDLFPPEVAESFIAQDRQVLERGEILDIPEEEIHTAGRGVRLQHTRKIPLLDDAGRPTHLLGISEDVTDARERESQIHRLNAALQARAEEVERVNSAKSVFLATMSHEIRTPMNGMLGLLELLNLSPLDEKQRQTLYTVLESGQSLLRIIDDVLDFSKIEADKLELREEVASVAAIVQEVRNIHSSVASSKGLVLTTIVDPALSPAVWVDSIRLRQVLNNFVSNAVKFTARGQVTIRVDVLVTVGDGQSLRFSVADTGAGIAPEDQKSLFAPFVQVGRVGNRLDGGTGLGLVISRRLVELMGGSVDLQSEVGKGTTLGFTLSVRTAPAALLPRPEEQRSAVLREMTAGMRQPPDAARAQAEGTLVLVVDDHPVNRALLEQQLATLGYATQTARDGEEALRQWESGRFGLVLTDCQMPGMDGYELARRIRRHEAAAGLRRMPVIACTAMALEGEVRKCLDAGMDDCLIKPVQLMEMLRTLQRWLPLPGGRPDAGPGAAAAQPAMPVGSVVDTALLEETWGSDPGTIRSILAAYGRSAGEDRAALRNAMVHRDLDAAMQVAHRMLGASRMVGAQGLADACALVNVASRERNWHALIAAMEAFEAEYARLGSELKSRGVDVATQHDQP